jgi:hypothetical protein
MIIDEKVVPYMGVDTKDDVCLGYWIERITEMLIQFEQGVDTWIIQELSQ